MNTVLALDFWVLFGAVAQCAMVLYSRRFRAHDWILPLILLVGGPAAFFGYITICSNSLEAAKIILIGFLFGLGGAALFVAEAAPARLNATALLSLTVTFWIVCAPLGSLPGWLWGAVPMSLIVAAYCAGPWKPPVPARLALYAWALAAAIVVAAAALPARTEGLLMEPERSAAAGFAPFEAVVVGAQFFLIFQLGVGLYLMLGLEKRMGDWNYADIVVARYDVDSRLSWSGFAALLGQAAALAWARRRGGEMNSQLVGLAAVAALAHAAMTGADAKGAEARPVGTPLPEPDPEDKALLAAAWTSALGFLNRQRWLIGWGLALSAAGA
ncbi:MAG: hypothetical protein ACHQ49_06120 [Elusimicrobiota bacterium]